MPPAFAGPRLIVVGPLPPTDCCAPVEVERVGAALGVGGGMANCGGGPVGWGDWRVVVDVMVLVTVCGAYAVPVGAGTGWEPGWGGGGAA